MVEFALKGGFEITADLFAGRGVMRILAGTFCFPFVIVVKRVLESMPHAELKRAADRAQIPGAPAGGAVLFVEEDWWWRRREKSAAFSVFWQGLDFLLATRRHFS